MLYWPVLLLLMTVAYVTFGMILWRSLTSADTAGSAYRVVMVMPAMLCLVLLAQAGFDYVVFPGGEVRVTMDSGVALEHQGTHYIPDYREMAGELYPDRISVSMPAWTEAGCSGQNCDRVWPAEYDLHIERNGNALTVPGGVDFYLWNHTLHDLDKVGAGVTWTGSLDREAGTFQMTMRHTELLLHPGVLNGTVHAPFWAPGDPMYVGVWVGIHMGLAVVLLLYCVTESLQLMQNRRDRERPAGGRPR